MNKLQLLSFCIVLFACDPSHTLIIRNNTGTSINVQVTTTKNITGFESLASADSLVTYKNLKGNPNSQLQKRTPIVVKDSLNYHFLLKSNWTVFVTPADIGGLPFRSITLNSQFGSDTIPFKPNPSKLINYELETKIIGFSKYILDIRPAKTPGK